MCADEGRNIVRTRDFGERLAGRLSFIRTESGSEKSELCVVKDFSNVEICGASNIRRWGWFDKNVKKNFVIQMKFMAIAS